VLGNGALHHHLLRMPLLCVQLRLQANELRRGTRVGRVSEDALKRSVERLNGAPGGGAVDTVHWVSLTFRAVAACFFGARASFLRLRSKWSMRYPFLCCVQRRAAQRHKKASGKREQSRRPGARRTQRTPPRTACDASLCSLPAAFCRLLRTRLLLRANKYRETAPRSSELAAALVHAHTLRRVPHTVAQDSATG
jgi:hypothetical protein